MILIGKLYKEEKQRLFDQQKGVCPICKRELDTDVMKNHLDHDHDLEGDNAGRVRGLLCNICNGWEGRVRHEFNRSGLVARGADYHTMLTNLLAYLGKDATKNNIHPDLVKDLKKQFARNDKPSMIAELNRLSFTYDEKDTKEKLSKAYNKQIQNHLKKIYA